MKTILVPIDFSDQANYAAKVAVRIAEKTNAKIHLLHMLEIPTNVLDSVNYSRSNYPSAFIFIKKTREKFKKFKKSPIFSNVALTGSMRLHRAFEGIIEESKKIKADLIVMGSSGATGLEEILVGSNTEKVVRNSDIPVLVIKKDIENFNLKNAVYASDFNLKSKNAFKKIIRFAKFFDTKLHLLKVNTIQNFETTKESSNRIKAFLDGSELQNYSLNIFNDVSIEEGILSFAKEAEVDLIILVTHGRKGLAHLFNGSISEDLVNHAKLPVLTFKM